VKAYVVAAELRQADMDPAAVGAAVTVELCGQWKHEGACRWPHNNDAAAGAFRTLFVASEEDEPEVRSRIESVLRPWIVGEPLDRDVLPEEEALAARLLASKA
jgi:hypothetical protein